MAMKKLLLGRIIEKREKEKREAKFNESLMEPPYRYDMVHVGDSDDDGVQCPSDCETEQQRMQHKLSVRSSVADQWDANQRGRHRIGGSSGVGTSRAGIWSWGWQFWCWHVKWYRDSIGLFNRNAAVAGRQNTPPGEPLLDEAGGRPSSQIAQQMGVDIDEYMTTQSQGRDIDWSSSSSEAAPPSLSGGGDRSGDDDDDGGNESAQPGGGANGGGVGSVGGGVVMEAKAQLVGIRDRVSERVATATNPDAKDAVDLLSKLVSHMQGIRNGDICQIGLA
ncbi:hypothetical protein HHK36_008075 [Tetracentron sinense]|uniref:Uncharacterized protein n=1 Tax=Tetracentron sinense TaxID=13715 RepID=A0A834ZEX9_TETSI|nr:hypothetical protein HHK36_008075 [Tetracentron sinense]